MDNTMTDYSTQYISRSYQEVTPDLLDEIVRRIISVANPAKIIFFGSRASGTHKPDSDIDLLIIEHDHPVDPQRRLAYDHALAGMYPDKTIIVHSMKDLEQWRYVPNHLITQAVREGKILYDDLSSWDDVAGNMGCVAEDVGHKTLHDLARLWFENGDEDLTACRKLVSAEGPYKVVCFHAQQAAEKYLKGFLSLHAISFEKTHDLEYLVTQSNNLLQLPELFELKNNLVSGYAITARYELGFHPSHDTAEDALEYAQRVREIILPHVPSTAKPDGR